MRAIDFKKKKDSEDSWLPSWIGGAVSTVTNLPGIKQGLQAAEPVFNVIDYPWKEYGAPILTQPFSGDKSTWGNLGDWFKGGFLTSPTIAPNLYNVQKARREYKEWDSPKYVKGGVELANPIYLASGAAPFKAASAVSKGLSASSKVGRAAGAFSTAGKTLETTGKGIGYLESLPGRGASKVLRKSFDVLPKTERTLFRRVPKMADDYISKGAYNEEQKAFIREYFDVSANEAIEGGLKQAPGRLPAGLDTRHLSDITNVVAKELDAIDPTRKLTGMKKLNTLFKAGIKRKPGFKKEMEALGASRAAKANAKYEELITQMNPNTGSLYTHEEARAISNKLREGSLVEATKGFDLTPEEAIALKMTDKEAVDFKNHIIGFNYKNKKGFESVSKLDMADEAWAGFTRLVFDNKPLTNYQARLLRQSLGDKFVWRMQTAAKNGTVAKILDIANLPRAILASWDMSAPFRQGMILHSRALTSGRFRDLGATYKEMFKAFGTEKWAVQADDILREARLYDDWITNGGYHSPLEHATLSTAEEQFMSTFASKYVPMVRRSERAYQTFLNQLRYKQYEHTVGMWERMAVKPESGITAEMIAESKSALNRLINAASGRGQLNQVLEGNLGAALNATLFSPRLLISRIQFPLYSLDTRVPVLVRKEAAKELTAFLGVGAGILGMASIAGAKIELDPRSSDFAKVRIGDTRHDIWAGYAQFSRLGAQLLTAQRKDAFGEMSEQNRWEALTRFAQSKTSPGSGLFIDIMKGQDYMGDAMSLNPEDLSKQVKKRVIPLFIQDMADAMYEYGSVKGAAITAPAFFGTGTQTYGNKGVEARDILSRQFGLPSNIWDKDILNDAREIAEPYYDIEEEMWSQYPELEAIKDQIRVLERVSPNEAVRIQMAYPQILRIRREITRRKKMLLAQNPQIKEALSILNR